MAPLFKFAVLIAVFLVLLRKKVDLGLVLALNTALTALLFGMDARGLGGALWGALSSHETLVLVAIVALVLYLGAYLQDGGHFRVMLDALQRLVREPRLTLAVPSAFMGLLPVPAGAMMGAPIVEEAGKRWGLSPAWKTFLNYWFRHIWEYSWPLYISLLMAATITRIPIKTLSLVQFPFTLLAAATGLVILFRGVPPLPREETRRNSWLEIRRVLWSLWPVLLTIVLVFVFRLGIAPALGVSAVLAFALSRETFRDRIRTLTRSLSPRIILLVFALMTFKGVLEVSGALEVLAGTLRPGGVSAYVLLFAAPFGVGLLTGMNQAYVAIAFPLLVPLFGESRMDLVPAIFAFVSGFAGILLSPAHLCLALTVNYFQAEWRDIYRILIPAVGVIFIAALALLVVFLLS